MRTLLGMQYGGVMPRQYQQGGDVPSAYRQFGKKPGAYKTSFGLAALRRHKLKQTAHEAAMEEAEAAAARQKRSGLFGSIGGLAGGFLGAALAPFTAGLSVPFMAGVGAGAGKLFGSKLGYNESWSPGMMFRGAEAPDIQDVRYGKEAGIEDIRAAGSRFRAGMGQDALMSGLKAGLIAGFAPGGGHYGKVAKWSKGLNAAKASAVLPTATQAATTAGQAGVFDPKGVNIGKGLALGRPTNPFAFNIEQGSQLLSPEGNLLDLALPLPNPVESFLPDIVGKGKSAYERFGGVGYGELGSQILQHDPLDYLGANPESDLYKWFMGGGEGGGWRGNPSGLTPQQYFHGLR